METLQKQVSEQVSRSQQLVDITKPATDEEVNLMRVINFINGLVYTTVRYIGMRLSGTLFNAIRRYDPTPEMLVHKEYKYYATIDVGGLYVLMQRLGIHHLVDWGCGLMLYANVINQYRKEKGEESLTFTGYENEIELCKLTPYYLSRRELASTQHINIYHQDILELTPDAAMGDAIYLWDPIIQPLNQLRNKIYECVTTQYIILHGGSLAYELLDDSRFIRVNAGSKFHSAFYVFLKVQGDEEEQLLSLPK